MGWLPLDVAWVGSAKDVLLFLVVVDESVVLVGQAFRVPADHEVSHVELGTCQPEEIFDSHLYQ